MTTPLNIVSLSIGGSFAISTLYIVLRFFKEIAKRDERFDRVIDKLSENISKQTTVLSELKEQHAVSMEIIRSFSNEIKKNGHSDNPTVRGIFN